MYTPNKFNYSSLSRETIDGVRKYATPDGEKLASVTTILDSTKPPEKQKILENWRKRVGPKRAAEITTEAASRGTRMHKWLENYVINGTTGEPGSNPYSKQSHQMANTIIKQGLIKCDEFWGTEIQLYYPKIYAGTTDLVGVHEGRPAIMDFKQTNKPKKREWIDDYFLQLVAYSMAHDALYDTKIKKGVIFMCSADNIYQEFIIEGAEFDDWCDKWFKRLEQYYSQYI
jgi:genome maintenance exonuclease 1